MKKFFTQGFINLFGNALASFLSFLFTVLIVKVLSKADYGEYTSMVAYVSFLTAPLTILSLMIVRKVGRAPKSERLVMGQKIINQFVNLARANWGLVLLLPVAWWVLANWANFASGWSAPTVILMIILGLVTTVFTAILTGWQAFLAVVAAAVFSTTIKLLGGIGVWQGHWQLLSVDVILVLATAGQLWLANWLVRKRIGKKPPVKAETTAALTSYFKKPTFLIPLWATIITTAIINVDMMTVKILQTADFAGEYGLYSLFAKILLYASLPLINVAFTFFNQSDEKVEGKKIFFTSAVLIGVLTAAMAVIYLFWPDFLIQILGKAEYVSLAANLWLAAIFGGLYSLAMLLAQYLIAKNRRLVYVGIIVPILQIGAIVIWHTQMQQVMLINILACICLIGIYSLGILKRKAGRC